MSFHSLLVYRVSDKKSVESLMGVPLQVTVFLFPGRLYTFFFVIDLGQY